MPAQVSCVHQIPQRSHQAFVGIRVQIILGVVLIERRLHFEWCLRGIAFKQIEVGKDLQSI